MDLRAAPLVAEESSSKLHIHVSPRIPHLGLIVTCTSTVLLLSVAYLLPPSYPHAGSSSCATFCYRSGEGCSPERWGTLPCKRGIVNECGSAAGQSPIDLVSVSQNGADGAAGGCNNDGDGDEGGDGGNVNVESSYWQANFEDGSCTFDTLTSEISDHTVKTNFPASPDDNACVRPRATLSHLGDSPWELLQLHFHTGSEHMINGNRYAGEIHLVHGSTVDDGKVSMNACILGVSP